MTALAEALGHAPDTPLLIINADDLGMCHAANVGAFETLTEGCATSASLMVPCPWSREAATRYAGEDIGVHLTLNAEFARYRWGPTTHSPTLLDGDGGFPATVEDVSEHADVDEVRRELAAQVERAILWGFDVTHLDSHMGTLQLRPELFDAYLEAAVDFDLPIRLSGAASEAAIGFPFRSLATDDGVLFPDHFLYEPGGSIRPLLDKYLKAPRPGVTEILGHPAIDTGELRAIAFDAETRVDDHRLLATEGDLRSRIDDAGVQLIGYRELRDLQRSQRASTSA
ncbi:MAG TPA: polysaccharide deacetylase family protein [Acidimicrobiales bacterium]|nr:polysaccharide deacetylase family protein [Acidimicrobiales bacterium]